MDANILVLFRSYQSVESHSGCKIWEAARATSAAPTFFKPIEIGRKQPFIDGGMGCNNPSRVVLEEAYKLFGDSYIGYILSIGTGHPKTISIKTPGFFQGFISLVNALKEIATDCEGTHQKMLGSFSHAPNTYFRLNVDQGMQNIKWSEWEKLHNVEAHTRQYMKREEVGDNLTLIVNAIRVPKAQLKIGQLSMKFIF